DNADAGVTVISTPSSGSLFPPGTTVVFSTSVDQNGNSNNCSFTITVSEAPIILSIKRKSANNVELMWPVSCASYQLEQSSVATVPMVWTPNSSPVIVTNYQNIVTIPHGGTNRFFRLRSP
ncbi:MAG: HYR domain-containing protein, partial [Verrucomicrobiota bacterium]